MGTARYELAGSGTTTSTLASGGIAPSVSPSSKVGLTESWNGTNWTETADMNTGTDEHATAGSSNSSSLAFGGDVPSSDSTEEFSSGPTTVTFTDS